MLDDIFFVDINDLKLIDAIKKELSSFPEGVHDDITDSFAYGFIFLHNNIKEEDNLCLGVIA